MQARMQAAAAAARKHAAAAERVASTRGGAGPARRGSCGRPVVAWRAAAEREGRREGKASV